MAISFRYRVGLLVVLAAIALLAVTGVALVLGSRSERDLIGIETRYVPLIELDKDLETTFTRMTRALEDAAASGEVARIDDADKLRTELVAHLRTNEQIIADNGGDGASLEVELGLYYTAARVLSKQLADGTPPGQLVAQIDAMHRAQRAFAAHLDAATTPDRTRLTAAFQHARAQQRASLWIDIAVAVGALLVMTLLSWRIIRTTVRSVHAVKAGVARLAAGTFDQPIVVESTDELGDLATEANRTAARLSEYREEVAASRREAQELLAAAEAANKELETFSYSVSHDLRGPLRAIDGFSGALLEDCAAQLPPDGQDYLHRIRAAVARMAELIETLLRLSRMNRMELNRERVDLSALATEVAAGLGEIAVAPDVTASADPKLIRIVLENLFGNAVKFTSKTAAPKISFGVSDRTYFVRDNGAGFDMKYASGLFGPFHRLHSDKEFAGTGIGLATVSRIVQRHGGRIWAEAAVDAGATFYFTLPEARPGDRST